MAVAGASQFKYASILANTKQLAAVRPSLLGDGIGTVSLLDIGRGNSVRGVGLSASARALNKQYLEQSSGTINGLFSATVGNTSTVEALQTQIKALRSGLSIDKVAPSLRGDIVDEEV